MTTRLHKKFLCSYITVARKRIVDRFGIISFCLCFRYSSTMADIVLYTILDHLLYLTSIYDKY